MIKILSTKSHWISKPPSSTSAIDQCCLFKSQNTPKLQGLSPSDFPQKINLDQEGFGVGRTQNPPGSDSTSAWLRELRCWPVAPLSQVHFQWPFSAGFAGQTFSVSVTELGHTGCRDIPTHPARASQGWEGLAKVGSEVEGREKRKLPKKKKKTTSLDRPTISSCNIQILEPWPKIAAHLLPFPFALAPRNTKREVAEQNASFMRVWRMQASSWLDNPRQPSLNQGAAGVKATGGGSWNPGQGPGTLSVEGPCQAGAAFQVDKGTVPIRNECLRQKSLSTARSQRLFS